MKKIAVVIVVLVVSFICDTSSQELNQKKTYPFNDDNWEVLNESGESDSLTISNYDDRSGILLPLGHTANLNNNKFRNFSLEFDLASLTIAGVAFRLQDMGNYEYIYLRIMSNGSNDAVQYLPIFNSSFSWQLYNFPKYEAKARFPQKRLCAVDLKYQGDLNEGFMGAAFRQNLKEKGITYADTVFIQAIDSLSWQVIDPTNITIHHFYRDNSSIHVFNTLEWVHVKIEVIEQRALVYVEDMEVPVLIVDELKHSDLAGAIQLRTFFTDAYFANVSIQEIEDCNEAKTESPHLVLPNNYLSSWQLSPKFSKKEERILYQLDSLTQNVSNWRVISSDSDGLVNISRFFNETTGTTTLRARIHAETDREVTLLFDYAEHLMVVLNSELIYSKGIQRRNNEGRVIDGEEEIDLLLKQGVNELFFVITADNFKQNWGFIAKFESMEGVTIDRIFSD